MTRKRQNDISKNPPTITPSATWPTSANPAVLYLTLWPRLPGILSGREGGGCGEGPSSGDFRLCNFFKMTQLENARAGILSQVFLTPVPQILNIVQSLPCDTCDYEISTN